MIKPKERVYILTLTDCHSRWACARLNTRLTLSFVKRAQSLAPFLFHCIQSDHGSEFSSHFTALVQARGLRHRHSRVRQPNDNAQIERFNRTLQDELSEAIGQYRTNILKLNRAIQDYLKYYNGERLHMGLNFQTSLEVLRRS